MSQLLILSLSFDLKIVLSSVDVDLAIITCCDKLNVTLYHKDVPYILREGLTGCALGPFKQMLQSLVLGQKMTGNFVEVVFLARDQFEQVLVEIRSEHVLLSYSVVMLDMLQSWAAQLDLLQVVMEENENEKKSRGTGCCGLVGIND